MTFVDSEDGTGRPTLRQPRSERANDTQPTRSCDVIRLSHIPLLSRATWAIHRTLDLDDRHCVTALASTCPCPHCSARPCSCGGVALQETEYCVSGAPTPCLPSPTSPLCPATSPPPACCFQSQLQILLLDLLPHVCGMLPPVFSSTVAELLHSTPLPHAT
jgi:hypothetical protein